MSGGIAFVLSTDGGFARRCNPEFVDLEPLVQPSDVELVRELLARHVQCTGSELAARLLRDWTATAALFVKVMPRDYKRALGTSPFGVDAHAAVAVAVNTDVAVSTDVASGFGRTMEPVVNG
jgi:glutamate synthase domain-containing protein 3